jgi:hypothetical protein
VSDPPASTVKAALVWVLMHLWPRRERLAAGLARVVLWIWPGFREK